MRKPSVASGILLTAFVLMPLRGDDTRPVKVHIDSFTVIGISTVTTNEREAGPDALIPRMWARLRREDTLNRVPNRKGNSIIAVYCDYENGRKASYKYILGTAAAPTRFIPHGMVAQTIQAGAYARYTAQGGPMAVVELWKRIWSDEKPGGLERAYKTDYEVYPQSAESGPASRVDIFIGLSK